MRLAGDVLTDSRRGHARHSHIQLSCQLLEPDDASIKPLAADQEFRHLAALRLEHGLNSDGPFNPLVIFHGQAFILP